jgi:hypothetical protein
MLHDRNARREQQRVRGPFAVGGVVEVDRVDADQRGVVGGEPGGAGPGQEVVAVGVGRCAEPRVVAGVQQHGPAADLERRQGPDVDTALLRTLCWWNPALDRGRGGWQLAQAGVGFTITFAATNKTAPGGFGIQISYTPVSPQPTPLPTSALTILKTGAIVIA